MFTRKDNRSNHAAADSKLSRRERDNARHRRELLETATVLFLDQGVAQTTMRQIAERVGISVGAIYQHFPSKDDLLAAVIDLMVESYDDLRFEVSERDPGQPLEVLRQTLRDFVDSFEKNPRLVDFVISMESAHLAAVRETIHRYRMEDAELIQRAVELGQIRPVDSVALSAVLDGASIGLLRFLVKSDQRHRIGEIPSLIDALILEPLKTNATRS